MLLSAAKHSGFYPLKDSGHPARWFLTKKGKFRSIRTSSPKFSAQLGFSADSTTVLVPVLVNIHLQALGPE